LPTPLVRYRLDYRGATKFLKNTGGCAVPDYIKLAAVLTGTPLVILTGFWGPIWLEKLGNTIARRMGV
jgi:hypothetical protein